MQTFWSTEAHNVLLGWKPAGKCHSPGRGQFEKRFACPDSARAARALLSSFSRSLKFFFNKRRSSRWALRLEISERQQCQVWEAKTGLEHRRHDGATIQRPWCLVPRIPWECLGLLDIKNRLKNIQTHRSLERNVVVRQMMRSVFQIYTVAKWTANIVHNASYVSAIWNSYEGKFHGKYIVLIL